MRLVEVIEECSLCHTPDQVIWQITKTYATEQLDRLIQIFLRGIGSRHQVPGQVVYTLIGISSDYKEYGNMTNEQKIYAVGRIIAHWDQLSCESRDLLQL